MFLDGCGSAIIQFIGVSEVIEEVGRDEGF